MTVLTVAATVVLVEVAVILLPLFLLVRDRLAPARPVPPDPPLPSDPGITDPDRLIAISGLGPLHPGDVLTGTYYKIRGPGARFTDIRFDRLVEVEAEDVEFENCWFAGPEDTPAHSALVRVKNGAAGGSFTATHCTFAPSHPSNNADAVRGCNFALDACDLSGTVDGCHIYGDTQDYGDPRAGNVTITGSWFHDFVWYDDGSHSDGTHNDCIQVLGGTGIRIEHNRFTGTCYNAVVMVTQARQAVADLTVAGNVFACNGKTTADGSEVTVCGINLADGKGAGPVDGLAVRDNAFDSGAQTYPMLISGRTLDHPATDIRGNQWSDGSQPPPAVRRGR